MAITRDYYEILGVSREADESQIKKAFRRLARELHPDVNAHDPEAEEKFKEAAEAYEVLSDPERRQMYDAYGHDGLKSRGWTSHTNDFGSISDLFASFFGSGGFESVFGSGRRTQGGGPWQGDDIAVALEIELTEAAHGVERELELDVNEKCGECNGLGGSGIVTCFNCHGSGQMQAITRTPFGQLMRSANCQECRGSGRLPRDPCKHCHGQGVIETVRKIGVKIPAGIADGQQIRLAGNGHAGDHGGPNGDVYVVIRVREDKRFVRDGQDLITVVDVSSPHAALGATVEVETLDGPVPVQIRPGTQPGAEITLNSRGMPPLQRGRSGDLRVIVNVVTPKRLSREEKELFEKLAETIKPDSKHDEGVVGKLKRLFAG